MIADTPPQVAEFMSHDFNQEVVVTRHRGDIRLGLVEVGGEFEGSLAIWITKEQGIRLMADLSEVTA